MNKLDLVKSATNIIVGAGTTSIVGSIIKNNSQPKNLADQVTTAAATIVIGSMVADATKKYTSTKIDEIADWYNENLKKTKK